MGVEAKVYLPKIEKNQKLYLDGNIIPSDLTEDGKYLRARDAFGSGKYRFCVKM